jgi:TRAP transporter 4TM/12TM fusion protein
MLSRANFHIVFTARRVLRIVFSIIALIFALNYIFNLNIFIFRLFFTELSYLYVLLFLFVPLCFLYYSSTGKPHGSHIPFYDIILFLLSSACFLYFAIHGLDMTVKGWSFLAPAVPTATAVISWALLLETIRRTCGTGMLTFAIFFSLFPIFTSYMPGFLQGQGFSFFTTARFHFMSTSSVVGIPINVTATLLIGFILFGALLQSTGAGTFFLNLGFALLGNSRGGPAKVAIVSSGLFGSLSGDVSANVISTGSMTIPAMIKAGYPRHYSGAVEAVASTGGVLMPPVMGAAAFLISAFLNISYIHVVAAAALPGILYYFSLFMEFDFYAAKAGLTGLPREELPSIKAVLSSGWFYIFALLILIVTLVIFRETARAPFYACLSMIVLSMFGKETKFNIRRFLHFIETLGDYFISLTPIMAAAGMIMGALSVTGVAHAMSSELLSLAAGNLYLLIVLGFLASFILGTGMTITPCYIFLAVTLIPALGAFKLDPLATHLFVMYCGMISFITPPVAIAAFVASKIADAPAIKVAFAAMKFGFIFYLLPFCFLFNPAMIFHAPYKEIIQVIISSFIGIIMLAGGIQGYFPAIGRLGIPLRLLSFISGVLLFVPETISDSIGAVIAFWFFMPIVKKFIIAIFFAGKKIS